MTNKTTIILAALAAIAIVSTTISADMQTYGNKAYAQQASYYFLPQQNTTSVTGTATLSVSPDLVAIQLGVDTQAKTAQDAMSENAQATNATITAIQNLGIANNETGTNSFTIDPVYNQTGPYPPYNEYKNDLVGYQVSNTLLIKTTQLHLTGRILDAAVGAGANRVDSVSFLLSPAKQQSVQNDLISLAVLDAQSKAEKALAPLGQKIIGVKTVNLSEFNMPSPVQTYGMTAMSAPAPQMAQTPILASNQDITATVNVIFLIGAQ
ncbi:MAG: SIMPL domain-containing protein [Nitrosotalea sp.]